MKEKEVLLSAILVLLCGKALIFGVHDVAEALVFGFFMAVYCYFLTIKQKGQVEKEENLLTQIQTIRSGLDAVKMGMVVKGSHNTWATKK